jgi:hypothetical protein
MVKIPTDLVKDLSSCQQIDPHIDRPLDLVKDLVNVPLKKELIPNPIKDLVPAKNPDLISDPEFDLLFSTHR